jgi:hypothetical protein
MDIGKPQRVIAVEPLPELPAEPAIPVERKQQPDNVRKERAPVKH